MAKVKKEKEITSMVEALKEKFEVIIQDAEKFDNGNNVAGTRVRTGLQDAKVTIKEIRDAVQEVKEIRKS